MRELSGQCEIVGDALVTIADESSSTRSLRLVVGSSRKGRELVADWREGREGAVVRRDFAEQLEHMLRSLRGTQERLARPSSGSSRRTVPRGAATT